MVWKEHKGSYYTLELKHPQPKLPNSYFWTWDHSTNWVLDDPGLQNSGCHNPYLKRPEAFIEDYQRLTDFSAGLGIKGIVVWGFLRDSHGGVEYAKRVAGYASERGIAIMPGVGTTWYGGVYYEGNHPYNMETFICKNPSVRMLDEKGNTKTYAGVSYGVCPTHPLFREWQEESIQWLFREFAIGGVNLENGDFITCECPRCREVRHSRPEDEPAVYCFQEMGYAPALRMLEDRMDTSIISYATYTGFVPGKNPSSAEIVQNGSYMQCARPQMFDRFHKGSVAQWTITGMTLRKPLPLTVYLDDGVPDAVFENPCWPKDVRPPSIRSTAFQHYPSQWSGDRYREGISVIKESCLRAYGSGMEGVAIHGEVTSRYIPWALNYLAFSHFVHWPEDSLRDFAKKTLGNVLESEEAAQLFVEILARWNAGCVTEEDRKEIRSKMRSFQFLKGPGKKTIVEINRWQFWHWLDSMVNRLVEDQTVSFL